MRDGWLALTVGDLVAPTAERLGERSEPEILTCTERGGLIPQREKFTKRIATEDTSGYKVVRRFDLVYNPYLLWAGAIAQSLTYDLAITSPVYEVFTPRERVDARFAGLLLTDPRMVRVYDGISIGSIPRRRRAPAKDFLALPVVVPPLPEQHRIVDLVAAADEVGRAARSAAARYQDALAAVRQSFVSSRASTLRLGDLAALRSGAGWKKAQESRSPSPGATPVIGITNTLPDGRLVLDERKWVTGLPSGTELLTASSLVLIRTNGNRRRIGNTYRATEDVVGHAVSAFQISAQPSNPQDRDYLYHVLRALPVQRAITAAASGSTGLGNIAISWLREMLLPWPGADDRLQFVLTCEALDEAVQASGELAVATRKAQRAITAQLLSGARALTSSYDHLLEAM